MKFPNLGHGDRHLKGERTLIVARRLLEVGGANELNNGFDLLPRRLDQVAELPSGENKRDNSGDAADPLERSTNHRPSRRGLCRAAMGTQPRLRVDRLVASDALLLCYARGRLGAPWRRRNRRLFNRLGGGRGVFVLL